MGLFNKDRKPVVKSVERDSEDPNKINFEIGMPNDNSKTIAAASKAAKLIQEQERSFEHVKVLCTNIAGSNDYPFWQKKLCSELLHNAAKLERGMAKK